MDYRTGDTIVALATAPLPAGVAVLRLSGPLAWRVGESVLARLAEVMPGVMVYGDLGGIDNGMAVKFAGPRSFTGEDVVELHSHGGRAVVQGLLDLCLGFGGVRMALAGEFSRRAVMNGKMDLTAAEGLADLIAAGTEAQRRQALRQLNGELGKRFEDWRQRVLALLAQVEAAIDFPDEELEVLADPQLQAGMRGVLGDLQQALGARAGERVREGVRLAIVGRPNAGKSTLLNLLSGREVAIVSPIAGTTRDVVTSVMDIGGYPLVVADTAGLRETADSIEAEGVRRARGEAESADVLVAVVEGKDFPHGMEDVAELLAPGRTLVVVSKADLFELDFPGEVELEGNVYPAVAANLTDRSAFKRVLPALEKVVAGVAAESGAAALLTRERHRASVKTAIAALGNALVMSGQSSAEGSVAELVAEDLRAAARAIGEVTGRTDSEDVLDVVFSTFCVGK